MTEVELPDGRIVEFPDGMSREDMKAALKKLTPVKSAMQQRVEGALARGTVSPDSAARAAEMDAKAEAALNTDMSTAGRIRDNLIGVDDAVMSPGEKAATALNLGGEGLTLGLVGDEAAAAADAVIGRGTYDERLKRHRGNERQFFEENPVLATASMVAPSMALPTGVAMGAGGLIARMAKAAGIGGLGGGLFGFMEGEGDFTSRAASGGNSALVGGALGAAVPVVGAGATAAVNKLRGDRAIKAAAKAAPSKAATQQAASRMFDDIQMQSLPRGPFRQTAQQAIAKATSEGMDPMLTPSAARVAANIDDAARANTPQMGMRELDTLRRQSQVPAGNFGNRTEAALGAKFIKAIDEHVDNVAPRLGEKGREAREMWSRLRKMDQMDDIFARAEEYASGFQNGLMSEFRRILKNKKLQRGFTQAELKAMKKVTNPGVLQGIIRQVGRLGISLDNGSNALGGAIGAGLGGSVGGVPGAIATTAIGTAARKGSEALTRRAANRVSDVVRAPNVQLPTVSNQSRGLLEEMMLRASRPGAERTKEALKMR